MAFVIVNFPVHSSSRLKDQQQTDFGNLSSQINDKSGRHPGQVKRMIGVPGLFGMHRITDFNYSLPFRKIHSAD
jgi:hypothetical protein